MYTCSLWLFSWSKFQTLVTDYGATLWLKLYKEFCNENQNLRVQFNQGPVTHPNYLNAPEGCINIALGAHGLSQRALAKSNLILILKYINIFLIVQKCVLWHYSANANTGLCCVRRSVIIINPCGYVSPNLSAVW